MTKAQRTQARAILAKMTPTPWHLGDEMHGDWYVWGPDPKSYGYVAQVNACGTTTNPREQREANAEGVIMAINNFAAALDALDERDRVLGQITDVAGQYCADDSDPREAMQRIIEALK